MTGKKLFKYYLEEKEAYHNSRPQFDYRINRWKFNTYLRVPFSLVPRNMFYGWVLKGSIAYFLYFLLIKRTPYVKHINRQGYEYEKAHKAEQNVKW